MDDLIDILSAPKDKDPFWISRKRMVQEQIISRGISDSRVIKTMSEIPRHRFVDEALHSQAYSDAPLNIGENQTISQPFIVALMTQALQLKGHEKVLEIGTGCGYQTSVLAGLCKKVYTIERFKSLAMAARTRFREQQLKNLVLRVADGSIGWQERAPFDRILMACAAPKLPETLLDQLADGGVLVAPIAGESDDEQHLLRVTKTATGFQVDNLGACHFVKLVGDQGYRQ